MAGLLAAMEALSQGLFDAPLPPRGPDSVGQLVDGFCRLRDALASREAAMRQTEQLSVLLQEVNTKLAASREQLARVADQDHLTELANRRAFLSHLDRRLEALRAGGPPFALLYLDLDGFKPINDTHGHRAGDAVLCSVARSLQGALRSVDVAARVGGDEFAALLEGPRLSALESLGARVLEEVGRLIDFEGQPLRVGASVGVVVARDGEEGAEALLGRADQAMYVAKAAGGGRAQLDLLA